MPVLKACSPSEARQNVFDAIDRYVEVCGGCMSAKEADAISKKVLETWAPLPAKKVERIPSLVCLGDLLTEKEARRLAVIMSEPPVDPETKKAKKLTDEPAMREERLYLLASLERRTRSAVGEGDTAFELWAAWREISRRKSGKKGRDTDWKNEVHEALRPLLSERKTGDQLIDALGKCRGNWRSFRWSFVEEKKRQGFSSRWSPTVDANQAALARVNDNV